MAPRPGTIAQPREQKMNVHKPLQHVVGITIVVALLVGCRAPTVASTPVPPPAGPTPVASATPLPLPPTATPAPPPTSIPATLPAPTGEPRPDGLSEDEAATLGSLEQVDDYPLYMMRYYGGYEERLASAGGVPDRAALSPSWACSLFAALGDTGNMLYGRNFDWDYSPMVLLFTDPPDGYASVSMVDIAYLELEGADASRLADLPLAERRALLDAPRLPFDGMNEHGLVIGMAAVSPGDMPLDPAKETVGSVGVIRRMLDHARDVDEAVAILGSYNIDFEGGPPLHYLVADRSGRALLVEYYQGEMVVISNQGPWHLATNFLRTSAGTSASGTCWRYDRLGQQLEKTGGWLTMQGAMDLLAEVSQDSTQWSIVYGLSTGDVAVAVDREYGTRHAFQLGLAGP